MRVRFRRVMLETDRAGEDPTRPVVVELTTKGDLVFHNYDLDTDLAAEELGFEPSDTLSLYRNWERAVLLYGAPAQQRPIPQEFADQLDRVLPRLRQAATEACESSTYREPSSRWVDTAGLGLRFKLIGDANLVHVSVSGEPKKVWHSKFGKRNYPGVALTVLLQTTLRAYITLLNKIPDGVIYDPKKGYWAMAAGIVKVIDRNTAIVKAGKQGRGVSIVDAKALVRKDTEGDWIVQRWL